MTGKEERCGVTKISLFLKFKMTKVPLCRLVYIHTSVIISFLYLQLCTKVTRTTSVMKIEDP
jgi:hypothetical protein